MPRQTAIHGMLQARVVPAWIVTVTSVPSRAGVHTFSETDVYGRRRLIDFMSHEPLTPSDILTPDQLAERLQVSTNWVYEKSRARGSHGGKPLPVLRCGRYLRFYWPDVSEWLRAEDSA